MSDHIILLAAFHDAALAAIDIHSFNELLLSVHTLELDICISAGGGIVRLVLVTILKHLFGCHLDSLNLLFLLLDAGTRLSIAILCFHFLELFV